MVNPATGNIHAHYTICGARTGRASCSNPNFQNQPRDLDMRKVYTTTPGYEMMVSDFSQIEVRIFAEYSREEKMLKAFAAGRDIYKHTAALLLNKPYELVTKEERKHMKPLVLGLAYGLGATKYGHYAKKNYDITLSEAQSNDIVWKYRNLYDKLYKWQLEQPTKCEANKYTCFAALGKSNKLSEEKYYGASMNHPIQSTAATIMYLALIICERQLRGHDVRWLGTVHDEMILEYKPEDRELVKKVLTEGSIKAYNSIMKSERTLVNLVDPLWGINWADAKDEDKVR
jgi:DNA polymerase-1